MTGLTALALAATACGLTWWALAGVTSLAAPRLLRYSERFGPADRSWCVLGLALSPLVLAVAVTALVFVPPLSVLAVDGHCHGSACGAHVPFVGGPNPAFILFSVIAGGVIIGLVVVAALALWRAISITRMFAALTRPGADGSFRVLDCDGVIACCVGIWQPSVVVSRSLAARADPGQLRIVLLHEYAHACRCDNLRNLLAGIATLPWPRARRRRVLEALHNAADQCCDEFVAREIGDPGRVANTISLVSEWSDGPGAGFDGAVGQRIDRLLQSGRERGQLVRICAFVIPLAIVVIAAAAPALHYCAEAFLRLL